MPWILVAVALAYLAVFLLLPLLAIVQMAFADGWRLYIAAVTSPEARDALYLTLLSAAIAVPLNLVFGVLAAWVITKHDVPFKNVLIAVVDLPFAVSPIIAGLILVLLYGTHGWLGPWLEALGIHVIFAKAGVVLATTFVTLPFIVRELIPLMQAQGTEAEESAIILGANGWQTFWRVTLPSIRWALLYGTLLCTARALGEFGAASVVSGHIRGRTLSLPLHIEMLFDDYHASAAFACASLLTGAALISLALKSWVAYRSRLQEDPAPIIEAPPGPPL